MKNNSTKRKKAPQAVSNVIQFPSVKPTEPPVYTPVGTRNQFKTLRVAVPVERYGFNEGDIIIYLVDEEPEDRDLAVYRLNDEMFIREYYDGAGHGELVGTVAAIQKIINRRVFKGGRQ